MFAVRVSKEEGEKTKRALSEAGVFDESHAIVQDGDALLIPVTGEVEGYDTVQAELPVNPQLPRSLKEALKDELTDAELDVLVTSFDVINDVAIIEIPDELLHKKTVIADALMQVHPRLKTVARKSGPVHGEFRVPELELIRGEETLTGYIENGVRMMVDVATCYFSPRLATERIRIAEQVKPGEHVCVFFAGVGPYALVIAKHASPERVYTIEKNTHAAMLLKNNIALNKMEPKIDDYSGDVKEIAPRLPKMDRVVMPLPKSAEDFLDEALMVLKKGGIVHFYNFAAGSDLFSDAVQKLSSKGNFEIIDKVKCGQIGPDTYRICIDARLIDQSFHDTEH